MLIHDPAVVDDQELIGAVAAAARLTGANARLQAEVRTQLVELEASRQRLLAAGDDERRRLERRLHDGAVRRLTALGDSLSGSARMRMKRLAHDSRARRSNSSVLRAIFKNLRPDCTRASYGARARRGARIPRGSEPDTR